MKSNPEGAYLGPRSVIRFSAMQTMTRALRGWGVLLVLVSLLTLSCSRTAPIHTPQPMSFAALPVKTVEAAIQQGAAQRGWQTRALQPGLMEAMLFVRGHSATVRIYYTATSVQIVYADSSNLKYSSDSTGRPWIHANYNSWVQNLAVDIERTLWGFRSGG